MSNNDLEDNTADLFLLQSVSRSHGIPVLEMDDHAKDVLYNGTVNDDYFFIAADALQEKDRLGLKAIYINGGTGFNHITALPLTIDRKTSVFLVTDVEEEFTYSPNGTINDLGVFVVHPNPAPAYITRTDRLWALHDTNMSSQFDRNTHARSIEGGVHFIAQLAQTVQTNESLRLFDTRIELDNLLPLKFSSLLNLTVPVRAAVEQQQQQPSSALDTLLIAHLRAHLAYAEVDVSASVNVSRFAVPYPLSFVSRYDMRLQWSMEREVNLTISPAFLSSTPSLVSGMEPMVVKLISNVELVFATMIDSEDTRVHLGHFCVSIEMVLPTVGAMHRSDGSTFISRMRIEASHIHACLEFPFLNVPDGISLHDQYDFSQITWNFAGR
jgi:hypothetical protein